MTTAENNRLDEERWRRLERRLASAMAQEVPGWTDEREGDSGVTLVEVFAFLAEQLLYRSNVLPDRARTRFYEALGTLASHWPPDNAAGVLVYVDGKEWRQTGDLANAGPDDQVFTVSDDGRIAFGDGQHGRRPPAGARVVASCEGGAGARGGTRVSVAIDWPPTRSKYTVTTDPEGSIGIGSTAGRVEQFAGEKRVHYFDGQMLNAADLRTEQQYWLARRRLHNRMLHGPGVVDGLGVSVDSTSTNAIVVDPGLAIDGNGREVLLKERATLTASGTSPLFVVVSYLERHADPVPAPGGTTASRIEEGACVVLTQTENAADGVVVARVVPGETWSVDTAFVPAGVPR